MDPKSEPKKKKTLKAYLSIVFMVLLLFSIITFLLPTWVSTPGGKKFFTKFASNRLKGELAVEKISLSWFGEQSLKGITFRALDGTGSAQIKEISSSLALWKVLFKEIGNDQVSIIEPVSKYSIIPSTKEHNEHSPKIDSYMPLKKFKVLDLLSKLNIVNGNIEFTMPDSPSLLLSKISLSYFKHEGVSPKAFMKITSTASFQEREGNVSVDINLSNLLFSDIDAIIKDNKKIFGISKDSEFLTRFEANNLPVEGLNLWAKNYLKKTTFLHDFLGNGLGLELSFLAKNKEVSLDLGLDSTNTQARIFGSLHQGYFTLNIPATIQQKISKQIFKDLLGKNWNLSLSSSNDISLIGRLDHLSFPVDDFIPNFSKIILHGNLQVPSLFFDSYKNMPPVSLDNFFLNLKTLPNYHYRIEAHSNLNYNKINSLFKVRSTIEEPFTSFGEIDEEHLRINTMTHLKDFPLRLLEKSHNVKKVEETLGDHFTGNVITNYFQGRATHNISGQTPYLDIKNLHLAKTKILIATQPGAMTYTISPYWREILKKREGLSFQEFSPIEIFLERLFIHLPSINEGKWEPRKHSLEAKFSSKEIRAIWPKIIQKKKLPLYFHKTKLTLNAPNLDQFSFSFNTDISQPDRKSDLFHLIGSQAHFHSQGDIQIISDEDIILNELIVKLASAKFNMHAPKAEIKNSHITFLEPASLHYRLHPELIRYLNLELPQWPQLDNIPNIHLDIKKLSFPLDRRRLNELQCNALMKIDHLSIKDFRHGYPFAFEGFQLNLDKQKEKNIYDFDIKTKVSKQEQSVKGTLLAKGSFNNLLNNSVPTEGNLHLSGKRIPLLSVEAIINKKDMLTPILGQEVYIDASLKKDADHNYLIKLNGGTDKSNASLNFIINDKGIKSLKSPLENKLYLNVTSDSLQAISKFYNKGSGIKPSFFSTSNELLIPASLILDLSSYQWVTKKSSDDSYLQAKLSSSPILLFNNLNKKRLKFTQFQGKALIKGSEANFSVSSNLEKALIPGIYIPLSGKNQLPFSFSAKFKKNPGLWSFNNLSKSTLKLDAQLFPTYIILDVTPLTWDDARLLYSIIPPFMQVHLTGSKKPNLSLIKASVSSDELSFSGEGQVTKNNLSLKKPLEISWNPSKNTLSSLSKKPELNFLSDVKLSSPIKFTVQKEGFSLPLENKSLKTFNGYVRIDAGKFSLSQNSNLFKLVKLFDKTASDTQVWLAPFFVEANENQFTIPRIDALINNDFELIAFSKLQQRLQKLEGGIGFPSKSLEKLLKLSDLPENAMIIIPIQGSLQNPKLNIETLVLKLAALKAADKQSPSKNPLKNILKSAPSSLPPRPNFLPWEK
jgi:hypothetical protein